jgi:hypothetical protein
VTELLSKTSSRQCEGCVMKSHHCKFLNTINLDADDGTIIISSSGGLFTVKLPAGILRFDPFLTRPSMMQTLQDSI